MTADTAIAHPSLTQTPAAQRQHTLAMILWECGVSAVLAFIGFIPRIMLASQLDMVTDERTYIMAGKFYVPLLAHLNLTADGWNYNYEHPAFVKLLIGISLFINSHTGQRLSELFAARLPLVIAGTFLVLAVYWLGRGPFGHVVAFFAALCLAVSPWMAYFSAIAYLDMTMVTLITIAYLLLWPALRRPRLYLLAGVFAGVAIASKYPAYLVLPGMVLFIAYYVMAIRPRLPVEQRSPLPWRYWGAGTVLMGVSFFLADPSIWRQPASLLIRSLRFNLHHAKYGHLMFLAGQSSDYAQHWAIIYILFVKISAFITLPALFFIVFGLLRLVRFHMRKPDVTFPGARLWHAASSRSQAQITPTQPLESEAHLADIASTAFLLIWLLTSLCTFSLLTIVVGTHYALPLVPPLVIAGVLGLVTMLGYRRGMLRASGEALSAGKGSRSHALWDERGTSGDEQGSLRNEQGKSSDEQGTLRDRRVKPGMGLQLRALIPLALIAIALFVPPVVGLTTIYAADGYTSEFFRGEDAIVQVQYPAYREASLWLIAHTHSTGRVGMIAVIGSLQPDMYGQSWFRYNPDVNGRLHFSEVTPDSHKLPYDYLIWPMNIVQRGYAIPAAWRTHIVHTINAGGTTYCFILARDPTSITT
ncbi:MAG: glycosyltransferase family 39 protein [Ktedonobacteraceae bacterium]|nr:glycosyltransferase family 39 protein [Ktedonobacteraceae bacterium]